ncbi:glutaredoxin-C9-like [Prosopis cineraria]|uniref:glutaredoxin-C9-like n=1 Tax=Prosopis cineraria TaxID=364024 RepID=UPI0024106D78|nr:glutaredoxin-C9-like [Prosopis cineraria]XP_054778486.1 glutaredoxin-C9-like [Prosopis cineraria]
MQQAIPAGSRAGLRDISLPSNDVAVDPANKVARMVSENAVIIIARRGCCMCHVIKRLLQSLGVNPTVYDLHDDHEAAAVAGELSMKDAACSSNGGTVQFPAMFVGGKLLGGLERVMATHISGELAPMLKDAGALWL